MNDIVMDNLAYIAAGTSLALAGISSYLADRFRREWRKELDKKNMALSEADFYRNEEENLKLHCQDLEDKLAQARDIAIINADKNREENGWYRAKNHELTQYRGSILVVFRSFDGKKRFNRVHGRIRARFMRDKGSYCSGKTALAVLSDREGEGLWPGGPYVQDAFRRSATGELIPIVYNDGVLVYKNKKTTELA